MPNVVRVFKIEIRGRGILNVEFDSVQEAQDFAAASFWWGGKQYRVIRQFKKVAA
jgi:hypothetical protein